VHCIFCRIEKPERGGDGEHVLPLSLGGSWTIERVCVECDNDLGSRYDAALAKLTAIEDRRIELGLVGHSRRLPNRIRDGLREPVIVKGEPARRMSIKMDDAGRITSHHTIPYANFEVKVDPEGAVSVNLSPDQVGIDPRDLPKAGQIFRRFLKDALSKAGVSMTNEEEIRIIQHCIGALESVDVDTTVEVRMPNRKSGHLGSMLKVAYEAAWYWLGDSWLDDPVAVRINQHLRGNDSLDVRASLEQMSLRGFDVSPLEQSRAHVIALCKLESGEGVVDIQLFDKVGVSFVITGNLMAYSLPASHAVVMDPLSGTHYFTPTRDIYRRLRAKPMR
jgi:hypothetical protein